MLLILLNAVTFVILVPITIGARRFSNLDKGSKWLLYMLIPISANQFLSIIWSNFIGKNNMPFFYLYIVLELFFLLKIYQIHLKKSIFLHLIPLSLFTFLYFALWEFFGHPEQFWNYSTFLRSIEAIIVIILASCYFINEYQKQKVVHFYSTPGFWIHGGLIMYFSCNLLLFAFSELVYSQEKSTFLSIWIVHGIVTILLYISYTIAFLCNPKKTKF